MTKCKQSQIKNRVPTRFNRFLKHHIANLTPEIDFLDNFALVNYFSGSYWSKNNGMRASFWNRLSQAKMLVLAVEKKRSEWLAVQYTALRQRNRGFHGHYQLVGIVLDLGKSLSWISGLICYVDTGSGPHCTVTSKRPCARFPGPLCGSQYDCAVSIHSAARLWGKRLIDIFSYKVNFGLVPIPQS